MATHAKSSESKKDLQLKLLVLRDELESLQESLDQVPGVGYKYFTGATLYKRIIDLAFYVKEDKVTESQLKEVGLIERSLLIQNLIDDLDLYFSRHFASKHFLSLRRPVAKLVVDRFIEEENLSLEDWRDAKEKLLELLQARRTS